MAVYTLRIISALAVCSMALVPGPVQARFEDGPPRRIEPALIRSGDGSLIQTGPDITGPRDGARIPIESGGADLGGVDVFRTSEHDSVPIPAEARGLLADLDKLDLDESRSARTKKTLDGLARLQSTYTRSGRLDEAAAIRDAVDSFHLRLSGVLPAPANLTEYRGQTGRSLTFLVTGRTTGSVWGNGIYTDDSDIGTAAVHSGALKVGQKGVVRVTIFAARDAYEGAALNGVSSQDYGSWDGSYVIEADNRFIEAHRQELPAAAKRLLLEQTAAGPQNAAAFAVCIDGLRRLQAASSAAGSLDEALAIRGKISDMIGRRLGARDDPGMLTAFRGQNGETFYFNVTGRTTGSIWGSGTYTDDSDLGTAAVHAGLLKPWQKGVVRVMILPGLPGYEGSARNGVTTMDYGPWHGSYRLELTAKY